MRTCTVLLGLAFLSACNEPLESEIPLDLAPVNVVENPFVEGVFPTGFLEASQTTGVPAELLLAIANAETSLQMVEREVEFDGLERAYGVMGLLESRVAEAAELSGYTEDEIKLERVPNVVATAMLMEHWATADGAPLPDTLGGWAPILAEYSNIENPDAVAEYIHYEVYGAMETGFGVEGLEIKPQLLDPKWPLPASAGDRRTSEAGTIWTPSPNNSSRGGVSPSYVVIHTCEGSYSGCWGWLTNSNAGVSAHYVVNSTGSEVRQLVDEDRKAWHIGANYSCSRNSDVDCFRNGVSMNTHSIGIEHAGSSSQTYWDSGLIERSAELTCGITERHDIPIDRFHIFGHGQMQPWSRTDPGANWPWSAYMAEIEEACGQTPTPTPVPTPEPTPPPTDPTPTGVPFVIDSNNFANDQTRYYIDVSSSWFSSSSVSGHYNTGYWAGRTAAVSDAAEFRFNVTSASQCYRVEAWWPSAGDRPPAAVWLGWNADDNEVGRQTVDQRINGGRWNELGYWNFNQGWNKVMLSRWTTPGAFAIADAVRLTPSTGCN